MRTEIIYKHNFAALIDLIDCVYLRANEMLATCNVTWALIKQFTII